jgi:tRNA pseudouridine38-40 synthase
MPRYRINVAYDGTSYAGWQIQPNGLTVQEMLERVLGELTSQTVKVHGSGRTDQGVHARKQVAHFDLETRWHPPRLRKAVNALSPEDIRAGAIGRVPPDFHARRSVREKEYRYFVWNAETVPPFVNRYRAHVRQPLDLDAMRRAAELLTGRHDFAAFSANPKRIVESTVRLVSNVRVTKRGSEVVISARGEGFLYKMVRSLAGFIIKVGEGRAQPDEVPGILASRKRTAYVPTAPARGLFLWDVWY